MKNILIGIVVVIVLELGWYLGAPLFLDKEVDEDFPEVTPSGEIVEVEEEGELEMV